MSKDAWNVLRVITEHSQYDANDPSEWWLGELSREFVGEVRSMTDEEKKKEIISRHLEVEYQKKKQLLDERIKLFSEKWATINESYFKIVARVLKTTIADDVLYTGYLTSAGSCPFHTEKRWFMVRTDDTCGDMIAAHEILHMEFRRKYASLCLNEMKLSSKEFGDFQEATTFLLNEEMSGMLSRPDYGYKEHKKLRAMLTDEWKKHKDFDALLAYYMTIKDSWRKE